MSHFAWLGQLRHRQALVPLAFLSVIFVFSSLLVSHQVDRALLSYQDAHLTLSSHLLSEMFGEATQADQHRLKVLAVRPELGESYFVIKAEDDPTRLGDLLRQEQVAARAEDILAVQADGKLLYHLHPGRFEPLPQVQSQLDQMWRHGPVRDPETQLEQVVHSRLILAPEAAYLVTLAPLLDVENIVGAVVMVRHLDDAFLARLRDEMRKRYFAGTDRFQIALANGRQVIAASLRDDGLTEPLPNLDQPFARAVAGRPFRHLPVALATSGGVLVLGADTSDAGGLHTTIHLISTSVFAVVLVLLLIIILFNAKRVSLEQHALDLGNKERRFRRLAEATLEGLAFSDGGRLVDANPALGGLFGHSAATLAGMPLEELVVPEQRHLLAQAAAGGEGEVVEITCRRRNGDTFPAEVRSRLIDDETQPLLVTAVHDVTLRKQAEALLRQALTQAEQAKAEAERAFHELKQVQSQLVQTEKFASLGQLVAGVAHEINTPVGIGVTGASHLAGETQRIRQMFEGNTMRRGDFKEFIETTDKTAQLLLGNMNRASELIRGFKQVAVDRASTERRPFDLHDYLQEVLLSLRPRLRKTRVTVTVEVPAGVTVNSYPGALAGIVTNLVLNAVIHAFEPEQEGALTLAYREVDATELELAVIDNGKGIPAANLPRIFDPFFTTRRNSGGSGLGLNICFNLASQALGGHLNVTSQEGVGTTFVLRFPFQAPTSDLPAEGESN